jgi:uncharacterized membrane protein (DUF2068 family)
LVASIGLFKLVKAAALITFGVAVFVASPGRLARVIEHAIGWSGGAAGRETIMHLVGRLASVPSSTARHLGLFAFAYAAVFLVEGIGLLARRRWAEWLTVAVTASLVPLEIYELVRRPGPGKVVALILNVAIAIYLAHRRIQESPRLRRVFHRRHLMVLAGGGGRGLPTGRRAVRS